MNNNTHINGEGHKVLEYLSPDTMVLDLPCIMTQGKQLTKNMPYLLLQKKVGGHDIDAIRLLNFQHHEGIIYINVQDLQTNRCFYLSRNLEMDGNWWFWALSGFETLTDLPK